MAFVAGQKVRASQMEDIYDAALEPQRHGQWNQTVNQAITGGVDTVAAFGTENIATPLVTRMSGGAYHFFRIQRPGLWLASTTMRRLGGGGIFTVIRLAGLQRMSADSTQTTALTVPIWVAPGTENTPAADVDVRVWFPTSGNTEANNGSGWGRLDLMWLFPAP